MARLEHGATMRRREFVAGVGASAVVGPRGAWGQQASKPVVGFLRSTTLAEAAHLITAFRRGLKEAGYKRARTSRSNTDQPVITRSDCLPLPQN